MNIRQIGNFNGDLVTSILHNRGIFDIEKYINPTCEDDTNIYSIPNITDVCQIIKKHIGNTIVILVDSDADGNTSAAIMYKYLKMVNPLANVKYFIHEHKTHGLTPQFMEYLEVVKPDLVIVPDAGTNDVEQRETIVKNGMDLIIIDHHNEDKYCEYGILVNNHAQFPKNDINKNLTGAGMTYLVCKALDELVFYTDRVEELKDLAMVGLIGDCASLFENETRNLCMQAIKNIHSKMIKTVIETNKQDIDNVTFADMQWGGIIPLINSVVRIGTLEEKETMFKALADIEPDYFTVVQKRKLNKETRKYEHIDFKLNNCQLAVDYALNCRARQNKIINDEIKICDEQFDEKSGVQIYVVQNDECKILTGLLANKLTSIWQQPVIVVWELDGKYTGSLRGYEKTIKNFKKWCEDTELFELVQGHDNAAGVVFDKNSIGLIREKCRNIEPEEFYYEVDYIYENKADKNHIYQIHNASHIFKSGIPNPQFAVKNMKLDANQIAWSKNTLRIKLDGVTYIKFKTPKEEYLKLIENDEITMDLIGTFSVNEWNNMKFPQMMISEYEVIDDDYRNDNIIDFGIFA